MTNEIVTSVRSELEVARAAAAEEGGKKGGEKGGAEQSEEETLSANEARVSFLPTWAAAGGAEGWDAALALVVGLPRAQQAQRHLLPGYSYLTRGASFVPASLASLLASVVLHATLRPRWPSLLSYGRAAGGVARAILSRRFVTPLTDIGVCPLVPPLSPLRTTPLPCFELPRTDTGLDLINRRPRLSDQAALQDAETSLTNLLSDFWEDRKRLRDLSSGGEAADRAEKLSAVSRAYESEIRAGAVKNLLRGRMLRLMLIQAQLMKTESLKARVAWK